MKYLAFRIAALFAAFAISYFAIADYDEEITTNPTEPLTYSTNGTGPSILLLHDSSIQDLDWAETAKQLKTTFKVTLVDVTELLNNSNSVQKLKQVIEELKLDARHIAGSAHTEALVQIYAASYPSECDSFKLPLNSEDLQTLIILFNSTPFANS